MGHDYGIDLLIRYWRLVPAGIETTGVNLPGNLLGPHAVARAGQEVDYSFGKGHRLLIQIVGVFEQGIYPFFLWRKVLSDEI